MVHRPHIPYACGTYSVALRNSFRTHTEYEVDAIDYLVGNEHLERQLHKSDWSHDYVCPTRGRGYTCAIAYPLSFGAPPLRPVPI